MFKMQVGDSLMRGIAFGILGICAIFDIKKKEIPVVFVFIGIFTALGFDIWQMWNGKISITEMGFSFLPGIIFLFISFYTKEKIGYGDGLLLIMSGLYVGFYQCLLTVCISLVFTSVFALILLVLHKAGKNSEIPFAPFLAIGMGVGFFV